MKLGNDEEREGEEEGAIKEIRPFKAQRTNKYRDGHHACHRVLLRRLKRARD